MANDEDPTGSIEPIEQDWGRRWPVVLNDRDFSIIMEALDCLACLQLGPTHRPDQHNLHSDPGATMALLIDFQHRDANGCFEQSRADRKRQLEDALARRKTELQHLRVVGATPEVFKVFDEMIERIERELDQIDQADEGGEKR